MSNRIAPPTVLQTPGGSTPDKEAQLMKSVSQTTKRAVLYARVSTKEQAEKGYSMVQQLDALRSYCEREGIEIVGVYEDPGGSGAYLERPGLDSLCEQVAEDGVHFVLAQDRDRFARDPILVGLLRYEFEEHGARLKSIQDAYNDTPEGELTSGILDQIAAYERKQIAKRMWRGRRQRAWEGKIIAGNSAPYGFSFNGNRTNLVVNDSEMFTVRRVFEMVGCRGMSLNAPVAPWRTTECSRRVEGESGNESCCAT